jgi:pyridoxal phosphate enzyme (YggS family)
VDSIALLERIDRIAAEQGKTMPVLIQVNVSGEAAKFGVSPEAASELLEVSTQCMNVDLLGLMTMPPFTPDPADAATHFHKLRELRDVWRHQFGIPLDELSMGMSHDFEVAIEAGATWIRVGTALLGERKR